MSTLPLTVNTLTLANTRWFFRIEMSDVNGPARRTLQGYNMVKKSVR